MTIRDLLKRTPFRLAVTFSLFFITTVLVLFVVIYIGASARLVSDIRGRVQATQNSLALLDTEMTFDNLIKVVVSWNYPLVIPFANRIFFAATNPLAYATAWIVQHPEYAQQNPLTTLRLLSGDVNAVPVWGQGLEFEILINRTVGTGTAGEFARRLLYRVPIKASYIMRMQWDRKP